MSSITFERVEKHFGSVNVIPPFDLEIFDEEFVVFVGPSGCGKSTLLRIISGLESISAGDLYIGDTRVNDLSPSKRDIAMVFQDYALYPHMTVRKNLTFALEMQRMSKTEIGERVTRVAAQLQITPYLDRRPRALSGGQRQRVAMGRAMVREPQVFLFDEPLSNLDAKLRVDVRTEIKALSQSLRTTMVFVTHDQVEAMTLSDRIVVLNGGIIQQVGTPQDVYDAPANAFVAGFMGSPSMNMFDVEQREGSLVFTNGMGIAAGGRLAAALQTTDRQELRLGIRPEHLLVCENHEAEIDAEILVVEPLGSDTLCAFDLAGNRCIVRVDPDRRPQTGDRLPLKINKNRAHLFATDDVGLCLTSALSG